MAPERASSGRFLSIDTEPAAMTARVLRDSVTPSLRHRSANAQRSNVFSSPLHILLPHTCTGIQFGSRGETPERPFW